MDWIPVEQVTRIIFDVMLREKYQYETGTPSVQL
jgi:hypothetical protein